MRKIFLFALMFFMMVSTASAASIAKVSSGGSGAVTISTKTVYFKELMLVPSVADVNVNVYKGDGSLLFALIPVGSASTFTNVFSNQLLSTDGVKSEDGLKVELTGLGSNISFTTIYDE